MTTPRDFVKHDLTQCQHGQPDCAAVLRTIDPDDSDEAEKLADLLGAIDRAQAPSRHQGALL